MGAEQIVCIEKVTRGEELSPKFNFSLPLLSLPGGRFLVDVHLTGLLTLYYVTQSGKFHYFTHCLG